MQKNVAFPFLATVSNNEKTLANPYHVLSKHICEVVNIVDLSCKLVIESKTEKFSDLIFGDHFPQVLQSNFPLVAVFDQGFSD